MKASQSHPSGSALSDVLSPPFRSEKNNSPTLLLVDDEPRLLSSLCDLLDGRGFRLLTASTGRKALQQLQDHAFDLVLLDLGLPDISGHEVMEFINERRLECSVIVLSGHNGIDAAIGALNRGAFSYLRKPYPPEELLMTIHNALEKRRLEAENARIAWHLECSEKLYRHLVDNSPDIIYTLDLGGRFTFVNERVQKTLGFAQHELLGKHYSVLVHENDLERAKNVFSGQIIQAPAARDIELRLKCRNRDEGRIFHTTLMTVSFSSAGMPGHEDREGTLELAGTYVVARDITERKLAEEMISYHAHHDLLTDLPNRVLFKDHLAHAILQAGGSQTELAVLFIDLDRFKLVNDTLGHVKGDKLLQDVAARLKSIMRPGDLLARLGSDEFCLLLPGLQRRLDAQRIAEKCMTSLLHPFTLSGDKVHISASIGIAVYPHDGQTADELIRRADIAMDHVKMHGANGHGFFDDSMNNASMLKIAQEQSLWRALEQNQLEMYYQPQIDVETGNIVAAEALMRWNHPERGLLSAGQFLPAAEENGLILPISDWMIGAVCRDIQICRLTGCEPLRIAINLSPQYLDRVDFFGRLQDALTRFNIPAEQVEVEITENICIRNPQTAVEQLTKLCQLGVSVAIDDFGTGYSSLAYLHRLPVNTLKIDQSFVQEIQYEHGHFPVILAIISIARGLGLNLVAEGVETRMQLQYLETSGCRIMQGYHFHRPMPLRKLIELLPRTSKTTVAA